LRIITCKTQKALILTVLVVVNFFISKRFERASRHAENGAKDSNGADTDTAAAKELAETIAAEGAYLKESLGGPVIAESARPKGCVVIAREKTLVQLPSGKNADMDVVVATPAAAVASGECSTFLPFSALFHIFLNALSPNDFS
jgi:hypothetical protein